ncbi:Guanine nucleotide-binding protein-like 3 [Nosema bombycis CQ1]|uniref:Guanine nucleotide-binding protein-like 3 n=1 Tax=Nosema bombycis (strain CQ1 / CVCC 102059) TaxID=578461 RepID=R0MJB4_NOSB1|nr:Guanine nucleotide-binding protein-like 3 [Nosema bombycis CQ1]|eukprot:EOB14305.1 Guanine nucleotide-binding protein-like 3 [Nosema bombycis CQ1]
MLSFTYNQPYPLVNHIPFTTPLSFIFTPLNFFILKKRQSRRISSRKKHNIEKRIKTRAKKLSKIKKKEMKGNPKLPKSVLLTDEDLENLKRIKEEENQRREENTNFDFDSFKFFVDNSDLLIEVLDARDPLGSLNPFYENCIKEKSKKLIICINNKDGVPVEVVEYWESYLKSQGYEVINDKNISEIKGRIGIFGQKGVGKMYLYKKMNGSKGNGEGDDKGKEGSPLGMDNPSDFPLAASPLEPTSSSINIFKDLIQSPPSLLSLLRNTIPLKSIFPKKYLNDLLNSINKDDFCIYFGIPYFNSLKDLEIEFIKRFRLTPSDLNIKILEIILKEMHKGKIKFYRENLEGKIKYEF